MTRSERRAIVAAVIEADPHASNREVAAECGVSHPTVAAVRKALHGRTAPLRDTPTQAATAQAADGSVRMVQRLARVSRAAPDLLRPLSDTLITLNTAERMLVWPACIRQAVLAVTPRRGRWGKAIRWRDIEADVTMAAVLAAPEGTPTVGGVYAQLRLLGEARGVAVPPLL